MTDSHHDMLYLDLHSARECLCRAQISAPDWWRTSFQRALDIIDNAGSELCPAQWSRYDQPEPDRLNACPVEGCDDNRPHHHREDLDWGEYKVYTDAKP